MEKNLHDATEQSGLFTNKDWPICTYYVGERLDLRALPYPPLAQSPLLIHAGETGFISLFRTGIINFFDVPKPVQEQFLAELTPYIQEPFRQIESDETTLTVTPTRREGVLHDKIAITNFSLERLQIIAEVLAKSVVLAYYENTIAHAFDEVEPLALLLQRQGRGGQRAARLLRHIGNSLLIQHKMVARMGVLDKPELLWEHPELERLYVRLADEYELNERHLALERKIDLISTTATTLLELLHTRRSLRVEWYILGLILIEILLTLYELFIHS